jgi:hypothetical protein
MRARTEVAIGTAAFAVLIALAALAGGAGGSAGNPDQRASSFLDGPDGLKGFADVLERTGRKVIRWRGPASTPFENAPARSLIVVADPPVFSPDDVPLFFEAHTDALVAQEEMDVLFAGPGAEPYMICLGYDVSTTVLDSLQVRLEGHPDVFGWSHARLRVVNPADRQINSDNFAEESSTPCPSLFISSVDTLLMDPGGAPVLVELQVASTSSSVFVLADVSLLSNAVLRAGALSAPLISTLIGSSTTVIFDELHQGFGAGGALGSTTIEWSKRAPVGWMFWQLAIVGALAFLAGAVRFGPVVAAIPRARRSSREHVRALATALATAKGNDVAIGAIVRGLRRRLHGAGRGPGMHTTGDWRQWATGLVDRATSKRDRARVARLAALTQPGQTNTAVRSAANAVEDVWEALHH